MQVHNALGFCYFSMEKTDLAIAEYRKAVDLQQGYVTAWNNLGDAYERSKQWRCGCGWARSSAVLNRGAFAKWCVQRPIQLRVCANLELPAASPTPPACLPCRDALAAYQEALAYAPNNKIALQRADFCRGRVERLGL